MIPLTAVSTAVDDSKTALNFSNPNHGPGVAWMTTDQMRAMLRAFGDTTEYYRLNSLGVTTELIAPSTNNQGTVVAAQYVQGRMKLFSGVTSATTAVNGNTYVFDHPPTYDQVTMGTTAYAGAAKDGCYMPLKLQELGRWRSANQCYAVAETNGSFSTTDPGYNQTF